MKFLGLVAVLTAILFSATAARAQTDADFVAAFAGRWQAVDPSLSDGSGVCTITLDSLSANGTFSALTKDCGGALAALSRWTIQGGQLVLMTDASGILARLGGNQKRMTGDAANGGHIIIERDGGDGTAGVLQSALNASGCFYLGYSQKCATGGDEGKPTVKDGAANVNVLVDLNARTEARSDATILGVVKKGTCLRVDTCALSTDGVWCRAQFGQAAGWVKKLALRQNRWPVITYTNQC